MTPVNLVIRRTSSIPTGPNVKSRTSQMSLTSFDTPFDEGNYSLITHKGVSEVKTTRDHEKKELQDLNDRFSNYLDKVRNLEAQNRKLADELEKLKAKWGKETSQIKAMYQAEIEEARRTLDEAEREKARLEIRVASLEEQIEELRVKLLLAQQEYALSQEKVTRQAQQINDYQLELGMLRKQLESLEGDREKDRKTIRELEELLRKVREQLDDETLAHIDAENRRQTLEEEIEFLKSVHDQEMKELAALAYRDTSPESREFWKNELALAIREIEHLFGEKVEDYKRDIEVSYSQKLQEFQRGAVHQTADNMKVKEDVKDLRASITDLREKISDLETKNNQLLREIEALRREKEERERDLEAENSRLRDNTGQLRAELDAVMRELQDVLGTKMSLDLEIAAYRKLLENEETRTTRIHEKFERTQSVKQSEPVLADESLGSSGIGEMSAKTTYARTAKGPIAVTDCPPHGIFMRLENTGKKAENIQGYKITRTIDGRDGPSITLDEQYTAVQPGQKLTFWAKGQKPASAPATDAEIEDSNWGIGSTVITKLFNPDGEERASLTQKTVYS